MKRSLPIIILSFLLLGGIRAAAGTIVSDTGKYDIHLKYGIEWGYTSTFIDRYHSVYFEPEVGYRIDRQGTEFFLYSNGNVYARVGVEFLRHYSLSFLAGYAGVKQDRRLFPLTARVTYFIDSYNTNGIMVWGEGGYGMPKDAKAPSYIFRTGTGYRLKMSKKSSLDFMISLQLTKDHPGIYNPDIPGYVPDLYVRRTDDIYGAVNFSLAISF